MEWPKDTTSRDAKRRAGRGLGRGIPLPRDGGPGVSPLKKFEIWGVIWCSLVYFGKKLTVLQFSTIVNENIAIVLDSCIDIVACY